MDFQVHFYRQNKPQLTIDELELFCMKIGEYKMQLVDDTVEYRHPDTGIHFDFVRQAAPGDAPSTCDGGWQYAGLTAVLPLNRATIYGAEAVPIIVILAKGFGLHILHSDSAEGTAPFEPEQQALMEAWITANHTAQDAPDADKKLEWKHESMSQWYAYQLLRKKLVDMLDESGHDAVHVPQVELYADTREDDAVKTVFRWENCEPTVFPGCDLSLVTRKRKKMLGLKQSDETGWTPVDQARNAVAQGLQPVQTDAGKLFLLSESMATKLADRVDLLNLEEDVDRFRPITVDQVIDV